MAKKKTTPAAEPTAAFPIVADRTPETPQNYTVLARRYRPQQFADLVGQEPVAQALTNALTGNRVAHAYLFTGTRGVGKTTTARILAKALNCVTGPTPTPCDQCASCKAIAVGDDVDVLEIDGASNRNLDDIRELRANVQYRPTRSRHKIYIIDEVHQLTKDAFNALLKTLEEPPPHVKFIFASTEVQKIPVTILSRCQRFDFIGIGSKRIVERLRRIVKDERVDADDEALELLARRAAGSMRDAQSLLDQMLAFGGGRLTAAQVHQLLGTADEGRVAELAAAILQNDAATALTLLGQANEEGVQFGELLDQLLDYWRDLMVLNSAGVEGDGLNFPARFHESMRGQAQGSTLDTILAGMDILAATKFRLRGTTHARVLVEMALVRLTRLENLASLSQLAEMLAGGAKQAEGATHVKKNFVAAKPDQGRDSLPTRSVGEESLPRSSPRPAQGKDSLPTTGVTAEPPPIPLSSESLEQIWRAALASLGPMHRAELERGESPAISGPNCLVLRFSASYNTSKEYCQEAARSERLEEGLRKVTGRRIAVRYEMAADGPAGPVLDPVPRPTRSRQDREMDEQVPLVRAAKDLLGAQVLRREEGFGQVALLDRPDQADPPAEAGEPEEREEPADV